MSADPSSEAEIWQLFGLCVYIRTCRMFLNGANFCASYFPIATILLTLQCDSTTINYTTACIHMGTLFTQWPGTKVIIATYTV